DAPHSLQSANMRIDPRQNWAEAEFSFDNRLNHKIIGIKRIYFQIMSIDEQKSVSCCEGDAFVAVEEWVIVRQGLHQSRRFFGYAGIVAGLWTKNSGLQQPL